MTVRILGPCFLCAAVLSGAARATAGDKPDAPVVAVAPPLSRQVPDTRIFVGRAEAAQSVQVRARVTGYLVKMAFKEGSEVKAGDLLFEIDPRPYQARVDQKVAELNVKKASLKLAKVIYERDLVIGKTPGAISPQQLDLDRAAVEEAEARLKLTEINIVLSRLELDFAKVSAPIAGTIGRATVTSGNLVTQDQTLLATIVSRDPIYVYFTIDERTLLRIHREIMQPLRASTPVSIALGDEQGFPHKGTINFVDNRVDAKTGSIVVRAVFANPRAAAGVQLLVPGMSVRIELSVGVRTALLVPKSALAVEPGIADEGTLLVVTKNVLQRRTVSLGTAQDGYREVRGDLTADDLIVLEPTTLKAGTVVQPKRTKLPDKAPN